MSINRRSILKAFGVAPAAAASIGQVINLEVMKLSGVGVGMGAPVGGYLGEQPTPPVGKKFFTFAEWMAAIGRESIKESSSHVVSIDPDLCAMQSLPLTTKIRMQRDRNYERRLSEQKTWFERMLARDGVVTCW